MKVRTNTKAGGNPAGTVVIKNEDGSLRVMHLS